MNTSLVAGISYTDSTVQNGTTYFYVTTAVDSTGTESVNSNEVTAPIP
jgi:TolB protein